MSVLNVVHSSTPLFLLSACLVLLDRCKASARHLSSMYHAKKHQTNRKCLVGMVVWLYNWHLENESLIILCKHSLSEICDKSFKPMVHRCQKSSWNWNAPSGGRTELENVKSTAPLSIFNFSSSTRRHFSNVMHSNFWSIDVKSPVEIGMHPLVAELKLKMWKAQHLFLYLISVLPPEGTFQMSCTPLLYLWTFGPKIQQQRFSFLDSSIMSLRIQAIHEAKKPSKISSVWTSWWIILSMHYLSKICMHGMILFYQ